MGLQFPYTDAIGWCYVTMLCYLELDWLQIQHLLSEIRSSDVLNPDIKAFFSFKKIYKIFQIFHHMEIYGIYIKY
jgi:hypothetical protein